MDYSIEYRCEFANEPLRTFKSTVRNCASADEAEKKLKDQMKKDFANLKLVVIYNTMPKKEKQDKTVDFLKKMFNMK